MVTWLYGTSKLVNLQPSSSRQHCAIFNSAIFLSCFDMHKYKTFDVVVLVVLVVSFFLWGLKFAAIHKNVTYSFSCVFASHNKSELSLYVSFPLLISTKWYYISWWKQAILDSRKKIHHLNLKRKKNQLLNVRQKHFYFILIFVRSIYMCSIFTISDNELENLKEFRATCCYVFFALSKLTSWRKKTHPNPMY